MADGLPGPGSIGSPLLAFIRLVAYVSVTLGAIPIQGANLLFNLPGAKSFPRTYHRMCCRILGFRILRRGRQSTEHPTLYVVNHCSYLDISILGSIIKGSFVAKSEVAQWPFFGYLAKLQRSVFVDRRPSSSGEQRDQLMSRLEAGDDIILFPEGTSGDGNRVLPFKSALFAVANREIDGKPLTVQPVTITYAKLDGMPMGRALRPYYAWYGDMELAPHIWKVAGLGIATVYVHFHEPVTYEQFGSRKKMSDYCQQQVSRGMAEALTGRRRPRRPATDAAAPDAVAPAASAQVDAA